MLCFRCGSPVTDGADTCDNCGQDLSSSVSQDTEKFTDLQKKLRQTGREWGRPATYKVGEVVAERYEISDVVGSGPVGEGNRWVTVVYYQPNVRDFGDYRLSGEVGLKVQLVGSLQLDVSFTWRHDHRAPEGLEEDDLGLRTGFTYHIR